MFKKTAGIQFSVVLTYLYIIQNSYFRFREQYDGTMQVDLIVSAMGQASSEKKYWGAVILAIARSFDRV